MPRPRTTSHTHQLILCNFYLPCISDLYIVTYG
jgi:hypothetical protein